MNGIAVQSFVADVVRSLVLEPDHVQVHVAEEEGHLVVDIHAAQSDLGRIIGKGGRTVDSLRTLLSLQTTPPAPGAKPRCVIRVQDPTDPAKSSTPGTPRAAASPSGRTKNVRAKSGAAEENTTPEKSSHNSQTSVIIYTKSRCPYCDAVKALLTSMNIGYTETSFEKQPDLFARLSEENNGWRTVPMVFIQDKFVGGFDETKALAQKGDLDHLRS